MKILFMKTSNKDYHKKNLIARRLLSLPLPDLSRLRQHGKFFKERFICPHDK
jgi:hypothetical protein